jgi:hypothetical protein
MNDDGQSILDLAYELPEDCDKAAILELLKDSIT